MAFNSMGMDKAVARFSSIFVRKPVHDDDVVDRLHHNASLILLLAFAGGTALMEYAGEPINCWTPQSYPQQHYTDHVNGYCWTHTLRYPTTAYHELLASRRIINFGTAFYRWVTLIFVLQGVLFKFPNLVWSYLNRQSGASLTKLKDLLTQAQLDKDERHLRMDEAAQYVHSWLASPRIPTPINLLNRDAPDPAAVENNSSQAPVTTSAMSSTIDLVQKTDSPPASALKPSHTLSSWSRRARKLKCLFLDCGRSSGKYLCVVYLLVKVLYLLNVAGNFIVLSVFLDTSFWRYGYEVIHQVMDNGDWSDPVNFPRMLICDFHLYEAGEASVTPATADDDADVHTVQCVLSINTVLEKLFVLQWFWLLALACLTLFTFCSWAVFVLCPCAPYLFARKYMKTLMYRAKDDPSNSGDESRSLEKFVKDYLKADGNFVLRMVEANMEHMVVKELVEHLWDNFKARTALSAAFDKERTEEIELMMMKDDETVVDVLAAEEETELSSDTPERRANSDKEEIVCEA